jgi:hypothetical protein
MIIIFSHEPNTAWGILSVAKSYYRLVPRRAMEVKERLLGRLTAHRMWQKLPLWENAFVEARQDLIVRGKRGFETDIVRCCSELIFLILTLGGSERMAHMFVKRVAQRENLNLEQKVELLLLVDKLTRAVTANISGPSTGDETGAAAAAAASKQQAEDKQVKGQTKSLRALFSRLVSPTRGGSSSDVDNKSGSGPPTPGDRSSPTRHGTGVGSPHSAPPGSSLLTPRTASSSFVAIDR